MKYNDNEVHLAESPSIHNAIHYTTQEQCPKMDFLASSTMYLRANNLNTSQILPRFFRMYGKYIQTFIFVLTEFNLYNFYLLYLCITS